MTGLSDKTQLGLQPRLLSAGWFAMTACVPVLFFFLILSRVFFFVAIFSPTDSFVAAFFILLPIVMAAFFGFTIGSRILNDGLVVNGWNAALHGALVAILAFFGHMLAYTFILAVNALVDLRQVIVSTLSVFYTGALLVGWLVVIAGAVSGWLLFRFSWRSVSAPLTTWTDKKGVLRLNGLAAIVLLLILVACYLPFRHAAQLERTQQSERDFFQAVWSNDV